MAVTIKDVAALAGVFPSTVSRVCNDHPSISSETRERIRNAMSKLGYEPSASAQQTDRGCVRLLKSMDRAYFSEYRDMLVMMLILDDGTRLGETLSAELDQLSIENRSLYLPADKTKGRKERTVYFSEKTARELRHWLQFKDRYCESPYLFPIRHSGRKVQVCTYETNFAKYIRRTGIQKHISPHTLRNNFAKRCLMSGMDIYTLSKILGHSSVQVTEKAYLDVTDGDIRKRYARFSPIDTIYYQNK